MTVIHRHLRLFLAGLLTGLLPLLAAAYLMAPTQGSEARLQLLPYAAARAFSGPELQRIASAFAERARADLPNPGDGELALSVEAELPDRLHLRLEGTTATAGRELLERIVDDAIATAREHDDRGEYNALTERLEALRTEIAATEAVPAATPELQAAQAAAEHLREALNSPAPWPNGWPDDPALNDVRDALRTLLLSAEEDSEAARELYERSRSVLLARLDKAVATLNEASLQSAPMSERRTQLEQEIAELEQRLEALMTSPWPRYTPRRYQETVTLAPPFWQQRAVLVTLGVGIGLLAGYLFAWFAERADRSVKQEAEITALGLPLLFSLKDTPALIPPPIPANRAKRHLRRVAVPVVVLTALLLLYTQRPVREQIDAWMAPAPSLPAEAAATKPPQERMAVAEDLPAPSPEVAPEPSGVRVATPAGSVSPAADASRWESVTRGERVTGGDAAPPPEIKVRASTFPTWEAPAVKRESGSATKPLQGETQTPAPQEVVALAPAEKDPQLTSPAPAPASVPAPKPEQPSAPTNEPASAEIPAPSAPVAKASAWDRKALPAPPTRPEAPIPEEGFIAGGDLRVYTLLSKGRVRKIPESPGQIYLQVIAQTDPSLAEWELAHFSDFGWSGSIIPKEVKGTLYHRVLIGPFRNSDEMHNARSRAGQETLELAFLKALLGQGRIERIPPERTRYRLAVGIKDDPERTEEILRDHGWPVLARAGDTLYLGPFSSWGNAQYYRDHAVNGHGWGPLYSSEGAPR